ncbi:hypothetical protein [Actinomadura sp. WMMA1423]|uniref:hypothetical protein n=1 Tax=Actinomadura sp. WMMA1423 TaxID=2591108 RepID=UPI00143CF114|nr:hypothetical protein [Actinomadura sp. WMMA1423]
MCAGGEAAAACAAGADAVVQCAAQVAGSDDAVAFAAVAWSVGADVAGSVAVGFGG